MIYNSVRFALSGSRSKCQIEVDESLWAVEADAGQIGQVIQNLVINADQSMPEGGTIVIAVKNIHTPSIRHCELPKGNYVEISVTDCGIGISEKYRQKIFDPYFTTKEKGSGLGLATSYSIIKRHGGFIDFTSELDKGTTFTIYLPAIETQKEFEKTPALSPSFSKRRILVMDDEELIRNIVMEMIKSLGHEVDLAENGETAIKKYLAAIESGKPFDIVILDLTIRGGMGGRDTIERLRVIDPGVRAIVSSGYSNDPIMANYREHGFLGVVAKPYRIKELNEALYNVMKLT